MELDRVVGVIAPFSWRQFFCGMARHRIGGSRYVDHAGNTVWSCRCGVRWFVQYIPKGPTDE